MSIEVPSYPNDQLPIPRASNYNGKTEELNIRTQMESGRYRQRRRFMNTLKMLNLQFRFTPSQFWFWRLWVVEGIGNGVSYFTILMRINDTLTTEKVRMVGDYSFSFSEGLYDVSCVVEVEDLDKDDLDLYDFIIQMGPGWEELDVTAADLHDLVHVQFPQTIGDI